MTRLAAWPVSDRTGDDAGAIIPILCLRSPHRTHQEADLADLLLRTVHQVDS